MRPIEFKGGVRKTGDVFILNGFVYWRYVKTTVTPKPNMLTHTFSDQFLKIDYKKNIHSYVGPEEFYKELNSFNEIKNNVHFYDTLIGEALKYSWLTDLLYTSTIMVFDQ